MTTLRCLTSLLVLASTACSAASGDGSLFNQQVGPTGGSGGTSSGAGAAGGFGGSGTGGGIGLDASGGGAAPGCAADPKVDGDGDGFTGADGDCNDCDANVNPGAYDFDANGVDEDCNGSSDDEPADCDSTVPLEGDDPVDAARALGLCRKAVAGSWGLVAARWTFPDGATGSGYNDKLGCDPPQTGQPPAAMQRGLLPGFGPAIAPREGKAMLALSSGAARPGHLELNPPDGEGSSPGGAQLCRASHAPPGFPKDSPACQVQTASDTDAQDPIALELEVRVPTNALGLSFDFDFYTFEWPGYVCDVYNDFFVALLASNAKGTPPDGNVSFDSQGSPVSVNNGFVEVCAGPTAAGGKQFPCSKGTAELAGTGFEDHAATSWLTTTAPVVPGEIIKLRFAIWDMGDDILDSTVLIDALRWDVQAGGTPSTTPSPPPR